MPDDARSLDFPWLERKSEEDEQILGSREAVKSAPLASLAALSHKRLSERDVGRIAAAAKGFISRKETIPADTRLTPLRICIASQATADFLIDEICVAGLRQGFLIDSFKTDFNQLADLAFGDYFDDPKHANIDFTLIGLDYRQLGFSHDAIGDRVRSEAEVEQKLQFVKSIVNGISSKTHVPCIIQNLVPQPHHSIASIDRGIPGTGDWLVDSFNRGLADFVRETGHLQLDLAGLAAYAGLTRWHHRGMWFMAKLPFSPSVVPLVAHRLSTLIAAAKGKSKKVLVLDLDNTLWGGVIGDDGVKGIVLGQGSAAGEAFLDIHKMALMLKARGVVLAVSSKNTDEIARNAFDEHPETILKIDDFAMFAANWDDKASNISHIAKVLELGLDSFVFLDDNPVERALIRRTLPQVSVPEVGEDASEYPSIVIQAGYFESLAFSEEDRQRAKMYQDNAKRSQQMESVGDLDAYLASLKMVMKVGSVGDNSRERVVQLINKSNQFNLTTRRYSVPEMIETENDPAAFTLRVALLDSFGDNGIIGVIVCKAIDDHWDIDTWLMSCRVLKRRVEEQVLQYLVEQARQRGIARIKGIYKPNDRNGLVRDHYAKLGFIRDEASADAEQLWWLPVDAYAPKELPFTLQAE